jgi:hypothetical protein
MKLYVTALCRLRQLAWFACLSLLPLEVTGQGKSEAWGKGTTLIDQQGRVWEAAQQGLWLSEGTHKTHFTIQNGLSKDTITALLLHTGELGSIGGSRQHYNDAVLGRSPSQLLVGF